jgi:hypothetical protein
MMKVYGESFIGEKFVSHIWDGGHFAKGALRAKDGRNIEVIYQGQWNDDSGADFHNAEIKIDGQIRKGDVEVHVKNSHWRVHHHDVDPRYNNTILHVTMWDDGISLLTRKQNGERIPTLILYDYLDSSIGKLWKTIEEGEEEPSPCRREAETMMPETIGMILDRVGMDRFLHRARVFEERLEGTGDAHTDQLLYEGIMEALGYSKNKEQFLDLARRVPLEILTGQPPEKIQAVLFGVAGLLPSQGGKRAKFDEETEEYVSKIEMLWKPFSSRFKDAQMSGEQWEFFRIRPENFPTKRIAGMSYILSNCGNGDRGGQGDTGTRRRGDAGRSPHRALSLLAMFLPVFVEATHASSMQTSRKLRNMLMPRASGYWARHYTFGGKRHREKPFLIGQNRAADIVVNVVSPAALAHARQLRDEELQQAVMEVYSSHPKLQDNKIIRYVAGQIFRNEKERGSVVDSAMRQQGLIHLYKSFCDVRNCQNCPLNE